MDEPTNKEAEAPPTTPTENAPPGRKPNGVSWDFGCLAVPMVGWSALCSYWFWSMMPIGAAILFGIMAGVLLCVIGALITGSGASRVVELAMGGCVSLVLAAILTPVFAQAKERARQTDCLSNVRAITAALRQYAADNEDILPPADSWTNAVGPYIAATRKVPAGRVPVYSCPSAKYSFGYAFADGLSSAEAGKIKPLRATRMLYDSIDGRPNAHDVGESLPKPGRHLKGNIIGYADGHARWVKDGETP